VADKDFPGLLATTQSEEGREAYKLYKYLEIVHSPAEELIKVHGITDKLSTELATANAAHVEGRRLAAKLTVIQALGRPLKLGESRAMLIKRCKNVLEANVPFCQRARCQVLSFSQAGLASQRLQGEARGERGVASGRPKRCSRTCRTR